MKKLTGMRSAHTHSRESGFIAETAWKSAARFASLYSWSEPADNCLRSDQWSLVISMCFMIFAQDGDLVKVLDALVNLLHAPKQTDEFSLVNCIVLVIQCNFLFTSKQWLV